MIELPYPVKILWPNGRTRNLKWRAAEVKKARTMAGWAAKAARIRLADSPIPVHIEVRPLSRGPAPDKDACVSAAKAYLDGIADALGINDRHFAAPTVSISDERTGQFIITVGE